MPILSTTALAKSAPYLLPFVKPMVKHLFGLEDGLLKDLVEKGIDLAGDDAADKIKAFLKLQPDAANGLLNEHLIRHTGAVLGALVKRYAKEEAPGAHRKDLLRLAQAVPGGWVDYVAADAGKLSALPEIDIQQRLAIALTPHTPAPALDPASFAEFFRWLSARKEILAPMQSGVTPALVRWVKKHLSTQLLIDLCKDTPEGNAAWKDGTLRILLGAHGKLDRLDAMLAVLHQKSDVTAIAIEDTRQTTKGIAATLQRDLSDKNAAARRKKCLGDMLDAFRGYEEIGLDNYAHAEQERPDVRKLFVHPACSEKHLRPEDVDAAEQNPSLDCHTIELLPLLTQPDYRRTVLLADPGMGKSTLIQTIIALLAESRTIDGARELEGTFPVPIILRDLVPLLPQDDIESWDWRLLLDTLITKYRREEKAPPLFDAYEGHEDEIRALIEKDSKAFLLIDGLDEIGNLQKRKAIVRVIQEGIRTVSKEARWLITSRIIGYEEAAVDMVNGPLIWPSSEENSEILSEEQRLKVAAAMVSRLEELWRSFNESAAIPESNGLNAGYSVSRYDRSSGRPRYDLASGLGHGHAGEKAVYYHFSIARRLYLVPFDNQRQEQFAQRWFRLRKVTDHSAELLREVRRPGADGVRVISRVPNLLCFMTILKRSGKPLPDGRAALYAEIAKAYLSGIDSAYRLSAVHGHDCPFDLASRLEILSHVAIVMQQLRSSDPQKQSTSRNAFSVGSILIPISHLQVLLLPVIQSMQAEGRVTRAISADTLLQDLLNHIARRSGLLIPRGEDAKSRPLFGFTHLSFQEYFAAVGLLAEFERHRNRFARQAEAAAEGMDLAEGDLDRELPPSGPHVFPKPMFAVFAASSIWHEVLIFVAETHARSPSMLLRWLFPPLEKTAPAAATIGQGGGLQSGGEVLPLMPVEAVSLAVRLAHDREINLQPETRTRWWRILWGACLEGTDSTWSGRDEPRWPIAPLLLERPEHRAEILQALATVQPQHPEKGLRLYKCDKLTSADLEHLAGLRGLKKLSLWGCTGLTDTTALAGLTGLWELQMGYCTGLQGSGALAGLGELRGLGVLSLWGCTGLTDTTALAGLTGLRELYLGDCIGLRGSAALAGLRELRGLEALWLHGCTGLTEEDVQTLREALGEKCRIDWR